MVSLWGFHCESSTSLASEISETLSLSHTCRRNTPSRRHTSGQTQTRTQGHIHTTHWDTQTPTFISSRQLAMEYRARLRRDLQSLRDAKNKDRRRQTQVYFFKGDFQFFYSFFGHPSNVTPPTPPTNALIPPSLSLHLPSPPPLLPPSTPGFI